MVCQNLKRTIGLYKWRYPSRYLLDEVNNGKTKKVYETCPKLTIQTPEVRHLCRQ